MIACLVWASASCATSPAASASSESTPSPPDAPPPGTEAWEGDALALPEASPLVGIVRLDQLLSHARSLRGWVAAEPAMFGDDGEAFVRRFRGFWGSMQSRLGFDLLSEQMPSQLGVDASRPVYMGVYPAAAGGGTSFVDTVQTTLRDQLELESDRDLLEALRASSDDETIPEGLNAEVLQNVRSKQPYTGMRLVVPASEPLKLLSKVTRLAKAFDYTSMESPDELLESEAWKVRAFYKLRSEWPGFVLRFNKRRVIVDVLFRAFRAQPRRARGDERRQALRDRFRQLFERSESGRPDAPRPEGTPTVGLSVDQKGASRYARLEGYRNVLESMTRSDVEQRDELLVRGLTYATMIGRNWEVGTERLTGLSYALRGPAAPRSDGETGRLVEMGMTLFGRRGEEALSTAESPLGLGVDDRGFGASLGLELLFAPRWREWLDLDDVSEMVDYSKARDFQPIFFTLALPRNLALLSVNLEEIPGDQLPDPFETLYQHRDHLERLELATTGALGQRRRNASYVAMIKLNPGTSRERRRRIAQAFPPIVASLFRLQAGDDGPTFDSIESTSWTEGQLTPLSDVERDDVVPLYYYIHDSEKQPFVMLSYGLERAGAQGEVDSILSKTARGASRRAALVRLEPATLVDAMTRFESNAQDSIDLGILTQRLGPLVLTLDPHVDDDVQQIRYEFEIRPPPEL